MRNWVATYANAGFIVLPKIRNIYGRWDYTLTVPVPETRATGRCRVAQGNRLVEGVNGNIRALTVICDISIALDVDDRLLITMDHVGFAKDTQYAIIGIERSATLNREIGTQKLTCIEAAVTVASNEFAPLNPPHDFLPNRVLDNPWDYILSWQRDAGIFILTYIHYDYMLPDYTIVSGDIVANGMSFDLSFTLSPYANLVGQHNFSVMSSYCRRGTETSAVSGK